VEKAMGATPKNLGPGPVRSVPLKTQAAARPQESVKSPVAPAPPSTLVTAPVAEAETVQPPAAVSTPAEDARLSSIKAALFDQSKRFLSSCLDHLSGWRFENGEARFTFGHKDSLYADLLKAHEQQETLRAVCAQVLGQPVRIYVTLEEQGVEAQVPRLSARERAERDPGVEAFRKKFDGALANVRDLSRE